ncbi:MAG: endolytic transglycosylase MltG [Spirochaetes bacterium]|nr:endolytic transglycosylase MltG [Spirochaetota bacterium]
MKRLWPVFGVILILAGTAFHLNAPPAGMRTARFSIHHGDGARRVARRLQGASLVGSRHFFLLLFVLRGRPTLYAGTYRIERGMTSLRVLDRISRAGASSVRITVPEGFTLRQIAERLDSLGITDGGRFMERCSDRRFLAGLGIHAASAEGYLFPDTYLFPPKTDPATVIRVMHHQMRRVIADSSPSFSGTMTRHEILVMASLIEKEAKLPEERTLISSVYHNRLRKGMKLDCDPTVRYALNKYGGRLTYRDLECDSPYNTYRVRGLPPTPICSPGREAIAAARSPDSTDYYYFVAKPDGSHHFSTTLREHLRAVKRFRDGG